LSDYSDHLRNHQRGNGAVTLADNLASAKLATLASIAADPANLLPAFEEAGGTSDLFNGLADDDLLAVFTAFEHCRERGGDRLFAARCAKFLLEQVGHWSDADDFGTGSTWTAKRLARFCESFYPCASVVTAHTRYTVELHERLRDAAAHLAAADRLLTPTIDDYRHADRRDDFSYLPTRKRKTTTTKRVVVSPLRYSGSAA
jgi:hypothetical protein